MRKLAIAIAAPILVFACAAAYYWNEIRVARAQTPTVVREAFQKYGHSVKAGDVPQRRIDILIQIEDPTFRSSRGIDLSTPGAGMTTIAQGLVKLLYFPNGFKPGIRKIRQTLIAEYAFDAQIAKEEQLDLYLNATYFGTVNGEAVHGLDQASQVYYKKSFRDLSDDEFIALIGMTISPNTLHPGTRSGAKRLLQVKRYLAGEIKPASVLDVEYKGKTSGSLAEEALMSFLRLLTDATPAGPPRMASANR